MIYLSKGILCHSSAKYGVQIAHGNQKYHLTDTEAALWVRGQLTFAPIYTKEEASVLHHLYEKGLAEYEQNNDDVAKYRILSRCVCCPDKMKPTGLFASQTEKNLIVWIRRAGIRLTTAELVYLTENRIRPSASLLSEGNRQVLIEKIYTKNTVFDNLLETQMEQASRRDEVIEALTVLLRKRLILLL